VLIVALSALHIWRVSHGAHVQNLLTAGKVALIVLFVVAGLFRGNLGLLAAPQPASVGAALGSTGFAVGLLLVSFAYTGWNAAAYVGGEVERPEKVLPRALVLGTVLVIVLYMALNLVFLCATPLEAIAGKVEVGHIAASALLGPLGGRVVSAIITLGLVSTVGAIIVTGPRVYEAVGRDVPRLAWLAHRSPDGGPTLAIVLQSGLALVMMFTAGFEALLTYVGFTVAVFSAVSVAAVFVLRRRQSTPSPFRTPGYPVTPLLFIALMLWMVVDGIVARPAIALAGTATVLTGLGVYFASSTGARRGYNHGEHGDG